MKLRSALVQCALLMLTACAPSQLHQQLQGKPADERRAILDNACHKEASPPLTVSSQHVAHTNKICDLMLNEIELHQQP